MRKQHLERVRDHNNKVIERRQNYSHENDGAKDQLVRRIEAAEERRNTTRKQALEKLQQHNKKVAEVKINLSAEREGAKSLLGKKLTAAEERRNQQLTKNQERL